jgi:hypothetical protein
MEGYIHRISIPPVDRLHGYNVGKYEVKLRSDRLHYRLQTVTRTVTRGPVTSVGWRVSGGQCRGGRKALRTFRKF